MKNVSKIKSKIESLKAQLHEAEAAERERKSKRVVKLVESSGLLDLQVEPPVLAREFRALADRLKSEKTGAESTDTANTEAQTPEPTPTASPAPETATPAADDAERAEEKGEKKRWGWK
jgi:septal ring-binding cell division protein DamX